MDEKLSKKIADHAQLIVGVWIEIIYSLWMQHNKNNYDNQTCNIKDVINVIMFRIAGKASDRMR